MNDTTNTTNTTDTTDTADTIDTITGKLASTSIAYPEVSAPNTQAPLAELATLITNFELTKKDIDLHLQSLKALKDKLATALPTNEEADETKPTKKYKRANRRARRNGYRSTKLQVKVNYVLDIIDNLSYRALRPTIGTNYASLYKAIHTANTDTTMLAGTAYIIALRTLRRLESMRPDSTVLSPLFNQFKNDIIRYAREYSELYLTESTEPNVPEDFVTVYHNLLIEHATCVKDTKGISTSGRPKRIILDAAAFVSSIKANVNGFFRKLTTAQPKKGV